MSFIQSGARSKVIKVKASNRRDTSSTNWLKRQLNDRYVTQAKIDGYRSRSAYKLLEINEKYNLLKPGMKIIDLGAAPGGWSQVASNIIGKNGAVIGVDLLEIEPLPNVITIKQDFMNPETIELIRLELEHKSPSKTEPQTDLNLVVDLVMSDMAANTTGHRATDHLRIIALCEQAFDFALTILKPGGHFFAKIFRGGTENELLNRVKLNFKIVKHFKPNSSRKESTEFYLIALHKK